MRISTIVCTLAVYTDAWSDLPLLVAANRDEFYERPASPPRLLGRGDAFGGCDLRAGGSWLAIGRHGLVVGILNRRTDRAPDPSCLSRGALCVELAEARSMDEALARLRAEDPDRYNPFNLLVADRRGALVAQNRGGRLSIEHLEPGRPQVEVSEAVLHRAADRGVHPRQNRRRGKSRPQSDGIRVEGRGPMRTGPEPRTQRVGHSFAAAARPQGTGYAPRPTVPGVPLPGQPRRPS